MMEETWVALGRGKIGRRSTCAKVPPPTQDSGSKLFWKLPRPVLFAPGSSSSFRFKLQPTPSVCQTKIPNGTPCHHD